MTNQACYSNRIVGTMLYYRRNGPVEVQMSTLDNKTIKKCGSPLQAHPSLQWSADPWSQFQLSCGKRRCQKRFSDSSRTSFPQPVKPFGDACKAAIDLTPAARQLLPRGEKPVRLRSNDIAGGPGGIPSNLLGIPQDRSQRIWYIWVLIVLVCHENFEGKPHQKILWRGIVPARGHEDIDQAFGQISSLIARGGFDNPGALLDLINGGSGIRHRNRIRNNNVFAQALDQTACWKDWTSQLGVKLKGLRFLTDD